MTATFRKGLVFLLIAIAPLLSCPVSSRASSYEDPILDALLCILHCVECLESGGSNTLACLACFNCLVDDGSTVNAGTAAQLDHSPWLRHAAEDVVAGMPANQAVHNRMPLSAPGHAWRLERHPTQLSIFNLGAVTDTAMILAIRDSAGTPVDLGNLTPQQALVPVPAGGQIVINLPPEILNSPYGINAISATKCGQNGDGYAFLPQGAQASVPTLNTTGIWAGIVLVTGLGSLFLLRKRRVSHASA